MSGAVPPMRHLVTVADIDPLVIEQFAVADMAENSALCAAPEEHGRAALGVDLLPVRLDVLGDLLPMDHVVSP
jgi:hypothetical protein